MTQVVKLYRHARFFIALMEHYELFTDLLETLGASRWPRVKKWVRFFNQHCVQALRVRFFSIMAVILPKATKTRPTG